MQANFDGMLSVFLIALNAFMIAILVVVAVDDLRNYKIRNALVVALLILSIVRMILFQDAAFIVGAIIFFVLALAAMLFAFYKNLVGGGDAKLISVAFLYVGPQSSLVFAVLLLLCTLLYFAAAKFELAPSQVVAGRMRIPFGPCIAAAWILTILASAALASAYRSHGG